MSAARDGERPVDAALAREHGLSADELARIVELLGRAPTLTELGIFSVMWSEHCSYKSSRAYLRTLPTAGERVILGPGENAGVVDIGDGDAIAFKMESHNHPSFIEPYQGAATGVGGILRDVFTMGARPIACLDSLRFGRPEHARTRHLVGGVVAGIAGYGNAFGVPTVGGEVAFDASYDGNVLVNVLAAGLLRRDRIFLGRAEGVGNPVLYIGARTGRDGIHGATMASAEFVDEASGGAGGAGAGGGSARQQAKRPTVQVGDPFLEKLLLEACLELMAGDALVGIQDMGAAGLTSSSIEMAGRAGSGLDLDVDAVPRREPGMTPYEVMLSESQERMILVARAGREAEVFAVCGKWEIECAVVGRVTATGRVVVRAGGEVVADLPVGPLTEGLRYDRPVRRPPWQDEVVKLDLAALGPPRGGVDAGDALLALLESPTVASKEWIYRQFDHQVRLGTVRGPGAADAAVVRIVDRERGDTGKAIALTTDCNSGFCFLDPYEGARLAVAEAYRNLACVGAEAVAVTDCLNFGNPERPEILWQLAECVRGLGDACRALGTAVVSGNVSLYNETEGRAIHPTPTVGMLGLLPDARQTVGAAALRSELAIGLLGVCTDELGGSEYLKVLYGRHAGRPPRLDVERERATARAAIALVRGGLARSAHDCAEGGLAVALAECCVAGADAVGATVDVPPSAAGGAAVGDVALLFGEAPSRIVVTYEREREGEVARVAAEAGAAFSPLGVTGGSRIAIAVGGRPLLDVAVADAARAWRSGFRRIVE